MTAGRIAATLARSVSMGTTTPRARDRKKTH